MAELFQDLAEEAFHSIPDCGLRNADFGMRNVE